jgi:general secretion pathway protein D
MERAKFIISILVGAAAVLIIWRVGFYPPVPEQTKETIENTAAAEPEPPGQDQRIVDESRRESASDVRVPTKASVERERRRNERADRGGKPGEAKTSDESENSTDADTEQKQIASAGEPNGPSEPNEPMEIVNLKNVEMKTIIDKLAKWTGKVIIPTDEAMKQKITIYAPEKLPRSQALSKIYSALRLKGFVAEETDGTIFLRPIAEAKLGEIPTISDDLPLAAIANKDQPVQMFFKLKNYSPSQMGQIILPLIGEHGYVSADENTGNLLVIDTVRSLMRIDLIIKQFDVVEAEQIETTYFEIRNGDPTEIVELLQTLLSKDGAVSTTSTGRDRRRSGPPTPAPRGSSSTGGTAVSVTVGTSRTQAVLIPQPTYNWIIVKATPEDIKMIEEWINKLDRAVPTMLVDQPLETIENKNQIVQKFFRLENYSPSQMSQIVQSFLSDSGIVSSDESTGNLIVTDSVENLLRIKSIITQFDIPEAEQTVTNYFEILHSDPTELVQLLRLLISGEAGTTSRTSSRSSYSSGRSYSSGGGYSSGSYRSSSRPRTSTSSVLIGPSQQPVVLIPVPRLKWIIARASAEDMKRLDEWIQKLDKEDPIKSEHETVPVRFVDPSEVAERLNEALQQVTGSELQANVLVQPLTQAKQIMVFGREDMRAMVKKLIQEIDIPSGMETRVFKLKNADADQIKENIDNLYGEDIPGSSSYYSSSALYYYYRYGRTQTAADTVKVISFPTMQQVTVIASPENLVKIEEQIKEWDVPLNVEEVKPRIIELKNSDPVQMAELLTDLFTEESSGGLSIYDILYGDRSEEKQKIIGPLYGQLTFADVPGTKKIIVISKIPAAYDVIQDLIFDLDREEMAEIPKVIELKYSDPEDLSERLNAMFVEPGQNAPIRYTAQGLSEESEMDATSSSSSSSSNSSNQNDNQSSQNTYTPPWSGSGARTAIDDEMPLSNVIGRIRFVPEPHTKSIMTLAPPEFMDDIEALIQKLDVPGKQVMIEAIIMEVEHSKVTSLGIELSTNPNAFGTLGENAITALGNLTHLGTHGTASGLISPISQNPFGATGSGTILGVGTDVYTLIDFLIRTTNARILNQQTLWTKDNEEAKFFKGSEVAFLGSESVTQQTTTQDISFEPVGMELRTRPSITPENKVDMIINVQISQLTSELVNSQPVRTKMNTRTNMIVQDKETLLLGGILFQKDSTVRRKLPLFGDLPLLGGLFRHNEIIQTNSEMLIFITPHVIEESAEELPEVTEKSKEKLDDIREELKGTVETLKSQMP